ncbi:MAG: hypothetical protein E7813_25605 [Bradyrhizobium sp.]|uniref:hypothetical protein n=1 Tax=Bradyrhizobium sp. TaxID=376 RepID=UPI0011FABC6E|nr:hypothetical protein [Bradyrhizobium sp.]THD59015.1 MAG: hypothetical protein E7813_25605 [Bradyrhizobium sp.]
MYCPLTGPEGLSQENFTLWLVNKALIKSSMEIQLLSKLAQQLHNFDLSPYYPQKLGNFPPAMGYMESLLWLILGVCNQAGRSLQP